MGIRQMKKVRNEEKGEVGHEVFHSNKEEVHGIIDWRLMGFNYPCSLFFRGEFCPLRSFKPLPVLRSCCFKVLSLTDSVRGRLAQLSLSHHQTWP